MKSFDRIRVLMLTIKTKSNKCEEPHNDRSEDVSAGPRVELTSPRKTDEEEHISGNK